MKYTSSGDKKLYIYIYIILFKKIMNEIKTKKTCIQRKENVFYVVWINEYLN